MALRNYSASLCFSYSVYKLEINVVYLFLQNALEDMNENYSDTIVMKPIYLARIHRRAKCYYCFYRF